MSTITTTRTLEYEVTEAVRELSEVRTRIEHKRNEIDRLRQKAAYLETYVRNLKASQRLLAPTDRSL